DRRARPRPLALRRRACCARRRAAAVAGRARPRLRRIWLRAAVLTAALSALLVGLTVFFSSEHVPLCLVSSAPRWHTPTGPALRHYEYVFPDQSLCVFDMDDDQKLV